MRAGRVARLLGCALAVGMLAAGCTKLDKISREAIADAGEVQRPDASDPDAGGRPDAGEPDAGNPEDELCLPGPEEVPNAAVLPSSVPCANSDVSWPQCIPDDCSAESFEAACQQYCEMTCEREYWFCTGYRCQDEGFCTSEEMRGTCEDLCDDDVGCLQAACEEKYEATCDDVECPRGARSVCDEVTCDNSCQFAFDGECDDGSEINGFLVPSCDLGTDCADCGARTECYDVGAECLDTTQCCGFADLEVLCVETGLEGFSVGRCMPTCVDDRDCDDDGACVEAQGTGDFELNVCLPGCAL